MNYRVVSLAVLCIHICVCATSHAAIELVGTLNSGTGSALGNVPPALDFSLSLDFDESNTPFAIVTGGTFSSTMGMIQIPGGDLIVVENGPNDQALFAVDTTGPTGSISFNFIGDGITNNAATISNLSSLIAAAGTATVSANFGAAGNYTGSIAIVPEPTGAALLGFCTMFVVMRRSRADRRRSSSF